MNASVNGIVVPDIAANPPAADAGPQRRDVTEQIYRQRRRHQKFVVLQPE